MKPTKGSTTDSSQSAGPRLLIVDDNPSIHRDFELVLLENAVDADLEADERQMYGQAAAPAVLKPAYNLDHALSGLEGVEKVKQSLAQARPYQLAFVDIRMPGIDGVETIQRIWELDARIQVVICTAFADYSWEDLVRRWGQTDKLLVLKKPFDSIEVTLLASALTEKWYLGRQAALKHEEMELLVARRTQKLLELQGPRVPAEAVPPEGPAATRELPLVLVVENDAAVARQLHQGLGGAYRLIEATNGEDGLHQAQDDVPDLVVTGLALPRLDGLGLCRRLKRGELTSHIPVIVIGAPGREDWRSRSLEAGADHYAAAPLNLASLGSRMEELLGAQRQAQERLAPAGAAPPRALAPNQADAQFLRRATETVDRHLSDFEFDVEALAKHMAVSRRQLFRKLKAVTGGTPHGLIRTMRLKRAAELLQQSHMNVTEVTYAVGFSDLKHFRTVFKEQFGVLPGEYPGPSSGS